MNRLQFHIPVLFLLAYLLTGCRKEEPAQDDLFDARSDSEIMYAIALDGGAIEGRWVLDYEEYLSYINDVLVGFDSASYDAGEITLDFNVNGSVMLISQGDTTFGTYSITANQLNLNLSSALHVTTFGSDGDRMRWHYSASTVVGSDIYRDDNEYLFSKQ